jgi:hypothetical protein
LSVIYGQCPFKRSILSIATKNPYWWQISLARTEALLPVCILVAASLEVVGSETILLINLTEEVADFAGHT